MGDGAVCGGCVEAPVAVEGDVEEVVSVEDGDFLLLFVQGVCVAGAGEPEHDEAAA